MRISLIVLAAGKSSRIGTLGRKPLLPWPTGPGSLLDQVLENFKNAHPWHDAIVVHRDDSPIYARIIQDAGAPYRSVINPDPEAQMSDSLRQGLDALSADVEGALIALGDMPFIDASIIQNILSQAKPDTIAQPCLKDRPANPVFFPATLFEALKQTQGDQGGREVLKANLEKLVRVNFEDPAPFHDIDTPEDYSTAVQRIQ